MKWKQIAIIILTALLSALGYDGVTSYMANTDKTEDPCVKAKECFDYTVEAILVDTVLTSVKIYEPGRPSYEATFKYLDKYTVVYKWRSSKNRQSVTEDDLKKSVAISEGGTGIVKVSILE